MSAHIHPANLVLYIIKGSVARYMWYSEHVISPQLRLGMHACILGYIWGRGAWCIFAPPPPLEMYHALRTSFAFN